MNIRGIIREFYILTALSRFSIAITSATYVVFLRERGLDLFEVNMVNFVFFFTLTVCEIPTGAFADIFGRKYSFIMSCILLMLGMFIYAASKTFLGFAMAEIFCAIGVTFSTGAFRAWFVDKLRHRGYKKSFSKIFSKAAQIRHVTGIVAAMIGAVMSEMWLPLPWLVGGFSFLACAIFALPLKEEYFVKEKFSFKSGLKAMKNVALKSSQYGYRDKRVRFILALVIIHVFAMQAPNMQWQPYFGESFDNKSIFGFIWCGMSISLMIGAWLAPKILSRFKNEKRILILCQITVGICIVGSGAIGVFPVALLMFFLHEVARGSFEPLKEAYLHDNIPSKERATIESFESLAHHFGGMVGLFISGIMAKRLGIDTTWIIMGVTLTVVTMMFIRRQKQK